MSCSVGRAIGAIGAIGSTVLSASGVVETS